MNRLTKNGLFLAIGFSIILFSSVNIPDLILPSQQMARINSSSLELINAVNSLRLSNGLPVYQVNHILMYIAQNHSDYQASIGVVTHFGADGSRPFQRALSAGYLVAGDLSMGGHFSENIIAGNNLSAEDAVNSWQSDFPHLNTMLSSTLQDIGAGVTVVGDMIYYTIDVGLSTSGGMVPTQFIGTIPTNSPGFGRKILTSTPGIDGSIYHIVEIGDTIWTIAQFYNITQEELIQLNSLENNFIYTGDKLLIRPKFTLTPTIPISTPTQRISQTPSHEPTISPQITDTEISPILISEKKSLDQNVVVLIIIISLTILSAAFFTLSGRKEINK
ncbi:MAG: CAP domain-containing protein [Chloroflexota bacterium]